MAAQDAKLEGVLKEEKRHKDTDDAFNTVIARTPETAIMSRDFHPAIFIRSYAVGAVI